MKLFETSARFEPQKNARMPRGESLQEQVSPLRSHLDRIGFYAPAFAGGIVLNLINLAIIGALVLRQRLVAAGPAVS